MVCCDNEVCFNSLEDSENANLIAPFVHVVGGHSVINSLPGGLLLKQCLQREALFYENMPEFLKKVTPACYALRKNGSTTILGTTQVENLTQNISNLSEALKNISPPKSFIVIDDLTFGMRTPRILDLKLGTRLHSDWCSEEKIRRAIKKCNDSTSSTLGVRFGGVKYCSHASKGEITIGKEVGKTMNQVEFEKSLSEFFTIAPELMIEVRKQFDEVKKVVLNAVGARFFGSSILIVIEDDVEDNSNSSPSDMVKVKLLDFGKSTFYGFPENIVNHEGFDDGALLGINFIEEQMKLKC